MSDLSISKIAVIDIGSNSLRMQISGIQNKSYRVIDEFKELIRIGDEIFVEGKLRKASISKILKVMGVFTHLIESHGVDVVRAVATESLRAAANSGMVLKRIKEECGIDVEIITGVEEGYYSYLAACYNFQINKVKSVIVDIGGGSSEFSIAENGVLMSSDSKLLGCSRLTRSFISDYPVSTCEYVNLKHHIVEQFPDVDESIDIVICTGGTMNNVGAIFSQAEHKEIDTPIKYVRRKFLKNLIFKLGRNDLANIKKIDGMEEKRADIMLAAALQIDHLLQLTQCEGFYTFSGGLRTGLTIDTMNQQGITLPFQSDSQDVRFSRLIEIGNKYAFDETHARQVCKLAKQLFHCLKFDLDLSERDWEVLEAAALLHDIGNYISFSKHHKHAEYLIMNSDLLGYTQNEKVMISHIARYHRKSMPKPTHSIYQTLEAPDVDRVLKLAGILRVADAFDRSHQGPVNRLQVDMDDATCQICPESRTDLYAEKTGFESKKDLLESILEKAVVLS